MFLFVFKNDKTWEMRGYCDISSVSVALVVMYAAFVIKWQLVNTLGCFLVVVKIIFGNSHKYSENVHAFGDAL